MRIDKDEIMHPEDKAAIAALSGTLGFKQLAKWLMEKYSEEQWRGLNLGSDLKLGRNQYPEIYKMLCDICDTLEISPVPELYLTLSRDINAGTYGDTRIFIKINSGLLESVPLQEVKTVLAHECGHILCRHTLYTTLSNLLLSGARMFVPALFTEPIQLALLRWQRMSEFSADRVSALVTGSSFHAENLLMRFCGPVQNAAGGQLNKEEYEKQLKEFEVLLAGNWSKTLQALAVMNMNHPLTAARILELRKWTRTPAFKRYTELLDVRTCPKCGNVLSEDGSNRFCRNCGIPL